MTQEIPNILTINISAGLSMTRRLSLYLPQIEYFISQGVPLQLILDSLNNNGFDLGMKTFSNALYRLRKRAKKGTLPNIYNEQKQTKNTSTTLVKSVPDLPRIAVAPPVGNRENSPTFEFDCHKEPQW